VLKTVSLSQAAIEVLAIVTYRQPIAPSGIELISGSASYSALDTLLQRGLIEHNRHHLLVRSALERALRLCSTVQSLKSIPMSSASSRVRG
jgi:segregation and condensation protein B